ncbi:MAG TPA: efflux transporter outer membrane subunit [Thermoanaerobaculia bacterium]|nr:efflux transporter outer membrane subunit [Thermoanaerobaculia bacterium]
MNATARPLAAVLALAAAGCSLAPAPEPPPIEPPPAWRETPPPAAASAVADRWWTAFGDPALDALVEEALDNNRDLLAAVARLAESRALAAAAGADRLPSLDLGASTARSRASQATGTLPPGIDATSTRTRVEAGLSFELDLFGRLSNRAEAARQELLAAPYSRDAVRLAVASDVAAAYLDLLALDRQAAVTERTVASRRRAFELIELRYRGGLSSRLDLERTRAERAAAEAVLPELERLRRARENQLALLLGRMPGEVSRERSLESLSAPAVPVGLPSELLLRRPDVAAAEARLAAASARIGVARAALFPTIRLTGAYGRESAELSDLFTPAAAVWRAALGLLQPIFDGGRNRALVAAAEARQEQAVIAYLAAAEGAFRDVEDALVAARTRRDRETALAEQADALARAVELAALRYREGQASLLEYLDVERSRLVAELELAAARRDRLVAAVALYRALGGGWSALAEAAEPASPAAGTPPG